MPMNNDGSAEDAFAWTCLVGAHPHEAARMDWSRFVAWVRAQAGTAVAEETIQEALDGEPDPDE